MFQSCARLFDEGPLGRSGKEISALFRWMGCTVAVYDCTVQGKADRRGETPRAHRSSKRRGKRSGRRNARKRRRLVTADPGSSSSLVTKAREYRANYREARQLSYVSRVVWRLVKLHKLADKISDRGDVARRTRLVRQCCDQARNLVDLVSRISGSPLLMARIRVYRALKWCGGRVHYIRYGNSWVDPDDAWESYKDFLAERQARSERAQYLQNIGGSRERSVLTVDLLGWLVTTSRSITPASETGGYDRSQVANAPCTTCGHAPCARPGANAKGVPLCKRLGILTRPRNDGGKQNKK